MVPKPVVFKFQGIPSKLRFHDDHAEIRDTNLGHANLGEFLRLCNQPTERSDMVFTLIRSDVASHLVSMQSMELIMTLVQHFIPRERVVKSEIGEEVLDL